MFPILFLQTLFVAVLLSVAENNIRYEPSWFPKYPKLTPRFLLLWGVIVLYCLGWIPYQIYTMHLEGIPFW